MKLYDKVRIKSQNVIGFIVDIVDDCYTVEKDRNEGPVFWSLPAHDLELVEQRYASHHQKAANPNHIANPLFFKSGTGDFYHIFSADFIFQQRRAPHTRHPDAVSHTFICT